MTRATLWPQDLIEALAETEHERWSGWERYRAGVQYETRDGEPNVDRWRRLRETAYVDLSEAEKQSDRDEVLKTLTVLERFGIKP